MVRSPRSLAHAVRLNVLIFVAAVASFAQQAVVTHNTNLRRDPSTQHRPIRQLTPPDTVELIEPEQNSGYYHVRTADDEEGWVFARFLRILSDSEPEPASPATAPATPT